MEGPSLIYSSYDWVRLLSQQVELPLQKDHYPLSQPPSSLQEQLTRWHEHSLAGTWSPTQAPEARAFRELGEALFAWISASLWLDKKNPGPLLLQTEPQWADYPWELLHDGRMWLALSRGIIRLGEHKYSQEHPRRYPQRYPQEHPKRYKSIPKGTPKSIPKSSAQGISTQKILPALMSPKYPSPLPLSQPR